MEEKSLKEIFSEMDEVSAEFFDYTDKITNKHQDECNGCALCGI